MLLNPFNNIAFIRDIFIISIEKAIYDQLIKLQ